MSPTLVHVVVLLVAGTLAQDDDMKDIANMLRETCIEESGVEMDVLRRMDTGIDLEPEPKLKCYIKCTMETTGMMTDGIVDPVIVVSLLPEHIRERNAAPLTACGTQKGVDDCDTAYLTQRCWQVSNRHDYFFI